MRYLNFSGLTIGWLLGTLTLSSCASLRGNGRIFLGAAAAGSVGAVGGAIFSPNFESRGLNALVFGLTGALAGGVIAALTNPPPAPPPATTLKDRELDLKGASRQMWSAPTGPLPAYVKQRLQPVIIEEYEEKDRLTEDGDLHVPHKVYRIKRPAELSARPITEAK